MLNSRSSLGAMLGMAMLKFGSPAVTDVDEISPGKYAPRRRDHTGRDLRSPAGTTRKRGKIGLGMHASGRTALQGFVPSNEKPAKGPARTLSVRDYKLTMATGRRYNRMASWERQERLRHLFTQGA